ncbi:MAG: hypothetical protein M3376_14490 [Actinomycetota bacterium]|nr:hypothetical protein [Actinomycetota bacterium]
MVATSMLIALPTFSSGATVKNDLRSFAPAQTRVGPADDPKIKPPLHGTNPHAQGTAAVVDLAPGTQRPLTVDANGNSSTEDVIVGRSRGEQRADGTYHGHITVAAAFGNEIIGRDTTPGQQIDEAIAKDLLDSLCTGSGICLEAVRVTSTTTGTGSFNRFTLASAALGGAIATPGSPSALPALRVGVAESTGNISSDGTCQTSTGGSRVADVRASTAIASVATSGSESRACRGQAPTQTNTSSVVELRGTGLGVPAAGCANGTADTVAGLPLLLPIICNADDSSSTSPAGNQAAAPYGVRNALDVYVLAVGTTPLVQVSTAQSESLAVAPAAVTTTPTPPTTAPTPTTTTPTTTTPAATTTTPAVTTPPAPETTPATTDDGPGTTDDTGGNGSPECSDGVDNDGDGKVDFGNDPGCSSAADDSEADNVKLSGNELPFTGTDVVVLGLAGSILLAAGLTLRGPARRRENEL